MKLNIFRTCLILFLLGHDFCFSQLDVTFVDLLKAFNNEKERLSDSINANSLSLRIDTVESFDFGKFSYLDSYYESSDDNRFVVTSDNNSIVSLKNYNVKVPDVFDYYDVVMTGDFVILMHYSGFNGQKRRNFGMFLIFPKEEIIMFIVFRNLSLSKKETDINDISEILFLNSKLFANRVFRFNEDGELISFGTIKYTELYIKEDFTLIINEGRPKINKLSVQDVLEIPKGFFYKPIKATTFYNVKPYSYIWKCYPIEYIVPE